MSGLTQRLCIWSGTVMIVLWLAGFWMLAGFLPLPSPDDSPQELAEIYLDDTTPTRIGLIISVIACSFLGPFIAVISVQLRRIEGRTAPLAQTQLAFGAILILEFVFPLMIMEACTFRSNRDLETLQAMHDTAWLMFIGVVSTAALQMVVIGAAILRDHREHPIYPRWMGYLSIWTGTLFMPGNIIVFFKTGPFAWDGMFAWWIPVSIFAIWIAGITWTTLQAIAKQEREPETVAEDAFEIDINRKVELLTAELAALRSERTTAG